MDNGLHTLDLEHGKLPDPVAQAIRVIMEEQDLMGKRLRELEEVNGKHTVILAAGEARRVVERLFGDGSGI